MFMSDYIYTGSMVYFIISSQEIRFISLFDKAGSFKY